MRRTPWTIALIAFLALASAFNVLWIRSNGAGPRMFDDSHFLIESLDVWEALQQGHYGKFVEESMKPARGFHPPMVKLLPVPMYFLFGTGTHAALYGYTLLIPVLGVYLFLLARLLTTSEKTAVVAVIITFLFPLMYGMWRNMMAEFGTTVATVASLYHMVKLVEGRGVVHASLAGAFLGWGLLWKISFPLFVAGPLAYLLLGAARSRGDGRPGMVDRLILSAAVAVAVAGPFYVVSGRLVFAWLAHTARSDVAGPWSLGPVLAFSTLARYWLSHINFGFSIYFFGMLVVVAALRLVFARLSVSPPGGGFLVAWLFPPFLVLSFHELKEARHLLPAYPALGLLIATGLNNLPALSKTPALMLAIWPLYLCVSSSFDLAWLPRKDVRWRGWVVSTANLELASLQIMPVYTFPATRMKWPTRETMEVIARHAAEIRDRAPRIRVAGNNPFFNGLALDYQARLLGHRFMFYSAFDRNLSMADFVVTLATPGRKYGPLDEPDPLLDRLLDDQRLPFVPLTALRFEQGGEVRVFRRDTSVVRPWLRPVEELARYGHHVMATPNDIRMRLPYIFVPESGAALEVSGACPRIDEAIALELENDAKPEMLFSVVDPVPSRPATSAQDRTISLNRFRGKIVEIQLAAGPASVQCDSSNRGGWSQIQMTYGSDKSR